MHSFQSYAPVRSGRSAQTETAGELLLAAAGMERHHLASLEPILEPKRRARCAPRSAPSVGRTGQGWWGTTDKRVSFRAQGLLRTPWGAGTWGVLPDAPGKLFATFGGADHELSFEAWPAFVSTRCSDGDVVHGIMSRVRV
jgi:hypothetical protein